jgi:hypothetical protein
VGGWIARGEWIARGTHGEEAEAVPHEGVEGVHGAAGLAVQQARRDEQQQVVGAARHATDQAVGRQMLQVLTDSLARSLCFPGASACIARGLTPRLP